MAAPAKFVVPRIPNATLARDALVTRLHGGSDSALTLISAGPGSGKTALLAAWVSELGGPPRWLTCEPEHADASRFWGDLAHAIGDSDFEILEAPDPRDRVQALVGVLAGTGTPTVIVIDDFHNARPDPSDVMALVGSLPPDVRLVISTRVDPALPLARLRVQGRLLELRQADLRFTPAESEALLSGLGVLLSADDLALLHELTEGWTAGVQLAGLSLQAHPRPVDLLRSLAESDRSLVDFLMNEVIDLQPEVIRDFLLVSAELESFDATLCDGVRDDHDSAEILERVRAANLFLVQVDPDDVWYRYHHLFGQFLRARLRATDPARVAVIHAAAASVCAERGDLMGATRHHMLAGDMTSAHRLLRESATTAMSVDDRVVAAQVARMWLDEFGEAAIEEAPTNVLDFVVVLAAVDRNADARRWLQRIEDRAATLDPEGAFLLRGVSGFVAMRDGDPERAAHYARLAIAEAKSRPVDNAWSSAAPVIAVQALSLLDDLDGADEALADAVIVAGAAPVMAQVRIPGHASVVAYQRGELVEAARLANEALAGADRLDLPGGNFGRADPQLTLARLLVEHLELDAGETALEAVMRVVEDQARPPVEMLVHLDLAGIAADRGEHVGAVERIALARTAMVAPTPATRSVVDRLEARIWLDRGETETAADRIKDLRPSAQTSLLEARWHVVAGDRRRARSILDGVEAATPRLRLERALLVARAGEDDALVMASMREALEIGQQLGFYRTIVCEGAEVMSLLARLPVDGGLADYVHRLLGAAPGIPAPGIPGPTGVDQRGLVDPLSDRELTVLRHLAGPQDSREIADSLYVSVNTVRTHVKAIYRKLGVGSRSDAVSTARDLALL